MQEQRPPPKRHAYLRCKQRLLLLQAFLNSTNINDFGTQIFFEDFSNKHRFHFQFFLSITDQELEREDWELIHIGDERVEGLFERAAAAVGVEELSQCSKEVRVDGDATTAAMWSIQHQQLRAAALWCWWCCVWDAQHLLQLHLWRLNWRHWQVWEWKLWGWLLKCLQAEAGQPRGVIHSREARSHHHGWPTHRINLSSAHPEGLWPLVLHQHALHQGILLAPTEHTEGDCSVPAGLHLQNESRVHGQREFEVWNRQFKFAVGPRWFLI